MLYSFFFHYILKFYLVHSQLSISLLLVYFLTKYGFFVSISFIIFKWWGSNLVRQAVNFIQLQCLFFLIIPHYSCFLLMQSKVTTEHLIFNWGKGLHIYLTLFITLFYSYAFSYTIYNKIRGSSMRMSISTNKCPV